MEIIESFGHFTPFVAICGLIFSLSSFLWLRRHTNTDSEMNRHAKIISSATMSFLKKEYSFLIIFLLMTTLIITSQLGVQSAVSFMLGAVTSVICSFVGVKGATKANLNTASAFRDNNKLLAFSLSFHGASIMGVIVASLGLLSLFIALHFFTETTLESLASFAMGASSIALFSHIGGGIYTKAAEIGTDLMTRESLEISVDDPNNPAAIVDHVGDNVGDSAGMGPDLFESYCGSIIATMLIGSTLQGSLEVQRAAIILPLLFASIGLVCSILTISSIRLLKKIGPSLSLKLAPFICLFFLLLGSCLLIDAINFEEFFIHPLSPFYAMATGSLIGVLMGLNARYFTSPYSHPVKRIAYASKAGAATSILTGLAQGIYSCIIPILLICLGVYSAHHFAGLYGIGIAAVGMISTIALTLTIDAQRPILNNAYSISQITNHHPKQIKIIEELMEIGSRTATIGKGFATGSAAFTALALFAAFATATRLDSMSLIDPRVVIGLFLGGILPFYVAANSINAVGHAAQKMVYEMRKQKKQLTKNSIEHNQKRFIKIVTSESLRQMAKPGLLAITVPVLIGFLIGKEALAGMLTGVSVCGIILALFFTNTGASFESAKKAFENGNIIGEHEGGSAHQASLIGHMIGDSFKDTVGPALNILVKLVAIVALVVAPLLS